MMQGLFATGAAVLAQGLAYAALLLSMKFIFVYLEFPYPLFISACNSFCGVIVLLFSSAVPVVSICTTKSHDGGAASPTSEVVDGAELLLSKGTRKQSATVSRLKNAKVPTTIPSRIAAQQHGDAGVTVLSLASSSCPSTTASSSEEYHDDVDESRRHHGGHYGSQTLIKTRRRTPEQCGTVFTDRADDAGAQKKFCHRLDTEDAQEAPATIDRSAQQVAETLDYGALIYFGGFFGAVNIGLSNQALSLLDPPNYGVLMKNLLLSDVIVFFLLDSLNDKSVASSEQQATFSAAASNATKAERESFTLEGAESFHDSTTSSAPAKQLSPEEHSRKRRLLARRYLFPWHALPNPFRVCLQLGLVLCGAVGSAWLVASAPDTSKSGEPSEPAAQLGKNEQTDWSPLLGASLCFLALLFSSLKDAVRQYCLHKEKRLPVFLERPLRGSGSAAISCSDRLVDVDGLGAGSAAGCGGADRFGKLHGQDIARGKVTISVVEYSAKACAVQFLCLLLGALSIEGRAPFLIFKAGLMGACGVVVTSASKEEQQRDGLLVVCTALCCLLGFAVTTATAELSKLTDVVSQACYRYLSFLLLAVFSFVVFRQALTGAQIALSGVMFCGIFWFALDFHCGEKRDGAQTTPPDPTEKPSAGAAVASALGPPSCAAISTAVGEACNGNRPVAKNHSPASSASNGGTDTSGSAWAGPAQCRVAISVFVSVAAIAFVWHNVNVSGASLRSGTALRSMALLQPPAPPGLVLSEPPLNGITLNMARAASRPLLRAAQFAPGHGRASRLKVGKKRATPRSENSGPKVARPWDPRAPLSSASGVGVGISRGREAKPAAHAGQIVKAGGKNNARGAQEKFDSDPAVASGETLVESGRLLAGQTVRKTPAPKQGVEEGSGPERSAAAAAPNDQYPLAAHGTDLRRLGIFLNPEKAAKGGSVAAIGEERADFQARGPAEDVAKGEACTCGRWGEFTRMDKPSDLGFCEALDEKTAAGRREIEHRLETTRGYTPTCCRRQTTQVLWDLADNVFDKYGLEYALHGGTALAAIRCGSITSYDYDLDLMVYAPGSLELAKRQLRMWVQDFRSNKKGASNTVGLMATRSRAKEENGGSPPRPWQIPIEDAATRSIGAHLRSRGVGSALIDEFLDELALSGSEGEELDPTKSHADADGASAAAPRATSPLAGSQASLRKDGDAVSIFEHVHGRDRIWQVGRAPSFLPNGTATFRLASVEFLVLQGLGAPDSFHPDPGPRNFEITGEFTNRDTRPGAVQNGSVHADIYVSDAKPPALRPVFFGGRIVKAAAEARAELHEKYGASYFTPLRWKKHGVEMQSVTSEDTCEKKSCEAARAEMREKLCPVVPDLMFGAAESEEC
ncbi:unnamed protein product [Amoebophrya sp. A120]|nr:unnamed protein product [Amoebophrya sp. A120]|eukprot:GSA120T00015171001.1